MPKEALWYVGFIGGAVITAFLTRLLGLGGIVQLLLVVAGGVAFGFAIDLLGSERPPGPGGSGAGPEGQ